MTRTVRVVAVDLGASSGRVVVGEVGADTLRLHTVAQFPNGPIRRPSGLHWDLVGLFERVVKGIRIAFESGPVASIGVDAWGVDYGLMHRGRLLDQPYCYRDEARGARGPAAVEAAIRGPDLYARNGLQFLPFSTIFQLAADPRVSEADRVLLVPDLMTYWLTGAQTSEHTNASTTGLLNVWSRDWDAELCGRLGFDHTLLAPLQDPGTPIGQILPHVANAVGGQAPVVAVASHDTASAVVGVPMVGDGSAYLSLGTWGLAGLEVDAPVVTEAARAANFTNEVGVDGRIRFLTNVMGTWLLSESLRDWGLPSGTLQSLLVAASDVADVGLFDVQDPRFLPPGDIPARIAGWYEERGLRAPDGAPATVRAIVESMAAAFASALSCAGRLAGCPLRRVHIVGGGALNSLLCQAVADRTGLPVIAGPVEATALGNVLIQARAFSHRDIGLDNMRGLVVRTQPLRRYMPHDS